ncbi:MAG: bacteriohemerythrin [Rhodospirillaceae bacterium]
MNVPTDFDSRWDVILWSDEFATGNAGIDADHQRLLALFNDFSLAVNAGKADAVTRGVLDELVDYTHYHFAREELLMQENSYPDYLGHKKMHDTFIRQIDDVCSHLSVGSDLSAFLLSFLSRWLSGHILGADRQLGRFLARGQIEH